MSNWFVEFGRYSFAYILQGLEKNRDLNRIQTAELNSSSCKLNYVVIESITQCVNKIKIVKIL